MAKVPFGFLRALWGVVGSSFVSGIAWSFGAGVAEVILTRYSKVVGSMLKRFNLLFHPSVTRIAVFCSALSNVAGLCTALGMAVGPWKAVIGEHHGAQIAAGLVLVGIGLTQIAGWGRSTVTEVDNNIKPQ